MGEGEDVSEVVFVIERLFCMKDLWCIMSAGSIHPA